MSYIALEEHLEAPKKEMTLDEWVDHLNEYDKECQRSSVFKVGCNPVP